MRRVLSAWSPISRQVGLFYGAAYTGKSYVNIVHNPMRFSSQDKSGNQESELFKKIQSPEASKNLASEAFIRIVKEDAQTKIAEEIKKFKAQLSQEKFVLEEDIKKFKELLRDNQNLVDAAVKQLRANADKEMAKFDDIATDEDTKAKPDDYVEFLLTLATLIMVVGITLSLLKIFDFLPWTDASKQRARQQKKIKELEEFVRNANKAVQGSTLHSGEAAVFSPAQENSQSALTNYRP